MLGGFRFGCCYGLGGVRVDVGLVLGGGMVGVEVWLGWS